jgi:hypothetical protein
MQVKTPPLRGSDGKAFTLTVDKFGKGIMTLFNTSRLPQDAVAESENMMLDDDGVWTVRPGTSDYGATLTTPIDGICSFTKYNSDGTMNTYVAVIDNGAFKYSSDGGSWTTVSGVTWTANKPASMKQVKSRIYIGNGTDALAYYDISAGTLNSFTALGTPGAPTPVKTGLGGTNYTAYYRISAVNEIGETAAGTEGSVTINKHRDDWILGTDYISLSWSAVASAVRYNIYYSDVASGEVYIDSVSAAASPTYIDYGTTIANIYQAYPTTDSTGGPKYTQFALAQNQLWATGDPTNPYRVAWTGTGLYLGSFNPFSGGGYVDLDSGGNEKPISVKSFRDGKGNAVATVLTSDPNGAGAVWAVTLTTVVIDTIQISVPSYQKQHGTIGTRSPRGVVEYSNSIWYPSPKGFQSLGSQQSILNVLVTKDISADVRPSVDGINNLYASLVCGVAFKGRIYWSVPYGSAVNNQTWVLDLERGGVWALPWTIGVKQFVEYTDSAGVIRLLAIPVTGTKLVQFSEANNSSDSGTAFATNLTSGLIHWDKDHTSWAYVHKIYAELAEPRGTITFTVSGTQKGKSFRQLGTRTITDTTAVSGYDADLYDNFLYDNSGSFGTTFAESSTIKVITINKLLNYLQWQLTTSDTNAGYSLMQIVIKGVILPTSDPSTYRS